MHVEPDYGVAQPRVVPGMLVVGEITHVPLGFVTHTYGTSFVMECTAGQRVYMPWWSVLGVSPEWVEVKIDTCGADA